MQKEEIFAEINSRIIANLEQGKLTWRQSWSDGVPANFVSKHRYQGINFLMLSFEPVSTPYFLTFLQAKQKNLRLKQGCKGRKIVFYKTLEIDTTNKKGEPSTKTFPYLKYSYVFSLEDTEGYTIPEPSLVAPAAMLDSIKATHAPDIRHALGRCYYSATDNYIATPQINDFISEEEYYSSLFHELIHWTSHPTRLNRTAAGKRDIKEYAYEELIAEIGSSYLLGLCGIQNALDNSSAYIQQWLNQAKGDNSYIISASVHAQKAVNFLLNQTNQIQGE